MVQFTETVLRDANQSLIATRMSYDKFAPILSEMDKAGYYSCEVWGGATFDVCLRFLGEDPWERLRRIRQAMPNTKLQMLLRGQNLLGYSHYPDDIVRRFVRASVKNGIDIIRVFDALNDLDNLRTAIEEVVDQGALASGGLAYTTSPVHTNEKYVQLARELKAMGVSTICIKDMAGILTPKNAYELISAIKEHVDLPVVLHTHCTAGLGFMSALKAAEAGADVIDTAISPFSSGTSQPATETLHYSLKEYGMDTGLNEEVLTKMAAFFKEMRAGYIADGTLNPISLTTDSQCLAYQIPGGMLSNLLSQLKSLGAEDRFEEVLLETPKVRADMGYPPLVTPTSQIIGSTAVQNVLAGERYKNVSAEIKAYCRGEYGKTPAPINEEARAKILQGDKPIVGRHADSLPADAYEQAEKRLGSLARCEEDVLSYIAFPAVAEKFFEERKAKEEQRVSYSIERID